ncbi:hypothetical protein D3C72_1453170 [compost metagenome]
MTRCVHLLQRLAQNFHNLLAVGGVEGFVLILQKHQAQGVFHGLHIRVLLDALLHDDGLDAVNHVVLVARFTQDAFRDSGMMPRQGLAPRQITHAPVRVALAADFPAPDMLATRGQHQRQGCLRGQLQHPFMQLLRQEQFLRTGFALPGEQIRIGAVVLVKPKQRLV